MDGFQTVLDGCAFASPDQAKLLHHSGKRFLINKNYFGHNIRSNLHLYT